MSTEQGSEDLGWDPSQLKSDDVAKRWGTKRVDKIRTPEEFQAAWLEELRIGLAVGHIAGRLLDRPTILNAIRILSEHAVTAAERPGLPLPPSLRRMSAETRKALERTAWHGFGGASDRAKGDRAIAALGALRIVRGRLGIAHRDYKPEKPVGVEPIEAELCGEFAAALDALPCLREAYRRWGIEPAKNDKRAA